MTEPKGSTLTGDMGRGTAPKSFLSHLQNITEEDHPSGS